MNWNLTPSFLRAWLALFLILPAFRPAVAGAEARSGAATGSITGRVQNVVTGQYLNNARVTIKGTDIAVMTDAFGTFRLVDIPSGPVVVNVFYTGLDAQAFSVDVPPDGSVVRDVDMTSASRYGSVVQLDAVQVGADREMDAQTLAVNEQRFAPNIKNVVSTDSMGDVLGYNVGEFMKLLPGVTTSTSGVEVTQIGVRGFDGSKTSIATDGIEMSSAEFSPTRAFNMINVTLNDISRIEVTKVPTPSMPASSVGGTVNLITKSAFERKKPSYRFGMSLIGNSQLLDLGKTSYGANDTKNYKIIPGVDFGMEVPLTKNLGFTLSGEHSHKYNPSNGAFTQTWQTTLAGSNASISTPYYRSINFRTVVRDQRKQAVGGKVDYRVTPNSVLSIGGSWSMVKTRNYISTFVPNVGANVTPSVATGVPFSFGPDYTIGATGRGGLTLNGNTDLFTHGKYYGNASYRFDNGLWKIEGAFNLAAGDRERPDKNVKKNFTSFSTAINSPLRIEFAGIGPEGPKSVRAFNNNNVELNLRDLSLHRPSGAAIGEYDILTPSRTAKIDVMRRIRFLPFPASVQAGAFWKVDRKDTRVDTESLTYNGPANLDLYAYQVHTDPDPGFAPQSYRYPSAIRLYQAWEANPALFTETAAQKRTREFNRRRDSTIFEETIHAGYVQAESSFFSGRLRLLTGVRYEKTRDYGEGPLSDPNAVYVRDPDGTFARTSAGARIRKPEAGAANSIEELDFIQKERAAVADRIYDGFYPSAHLTYTITERLLVRAAYASTFTRPNINNIVPTTSILDADLSDEQFLDPTIVRGTINVRNTGLRPWTADNYDVSVEYYTDKGGVFSAGAFVKDIKDFFASSTRRATPELLEELGYDERYTNWNITSTYNAGAARISGVELNMRQSLAELGPWGRYVTVFANGTRLRREGPQAGNFNGIYPKTANWGVTFSMKRFVMTGRWNYRGWVRGAEAEEFGTDGFEWLDPKMTLDVNVGWKLTKRFSLVATINNVLEEYDRESSFGSATPGYARQVVVTDFGSAISVGIRGTF